MNCCSHLFEIDTVTPQTPKGCEECLKMGDQWLHLRLCVTCRHVGCCDDSKNKHAVKHFHSTNHPLIKSFEPGEDWGWCYVDGITFGVSSWILNDGMVRCAWSDALRNATAVGEGYKMSEEDLEVLITTDDPGEDTLGEDTFHDNPIEKTGHTTRRNDQRTAVTDSESGG